MLTGSNRNGRRHEANGYHPPAAPPATADDEAGKRVYLEVLHYAKIEGGVRKFAVAEFTADGGATFHDQEIGEVRWYPFTPSPEERAAVERLRGDGRERTGWPLIDIDALVDGQAYGILAGLEHFPSFVYQRIEDLSQLQPSYRLPHDLEAIQRVTDHVHEGLRLVDAVFAWLRKHEMVVAGTLERLTPERRHELNGQADARALGQMSS